VALDDEIQFVLKMFGLNPQLMAKFLLDFVLECRNQLHQLIVGFGGQVFKISVFQLFGGQAGGAPWGV